MMNGPTHQKVFEWAKSGNIVAIQSWINSEACDLTILDAYHNTLLGIAVFNHHWELAKYLINSGAEVRVMLNNVPKYGAIPLLHIPMKYNRWELVEQMIRHGANSRYYCKYTVSPLNHFANMGNIEMVRYIIGCDLYLMALPPDDQFKKKQHRPAYVFNLDKMFYFNGEKTIVIPISIEKLDTLKAKLGIVDSDYIGPVVLLNEQLQWITAISGHNHHASSDIIGNPNHHSPLKVATIAGHLDIVRVLVEAGAHIGNKESLEGKGGVQAQYHFTPIQYAAMFGHRDIVLYLMEQRKYQDEYADSNMGFSLDFFGERTDYSAYLDVNRIVQYMLPYKRFAYLDDSQGRRNLRADILLLQARSAHYALQRSVLRITGTDIQIKQQCMEYLNRANLAIDILQRIDEEPLIVEEICRPQRTIVMKKMVFAWFCSSIATYSCNHPDNSANPGWKAISFWGANIDCVADRGYFYGNQLIHTNPGKIFDNYFSAILASLPQVINFLEHPDEIETLQRTALYQIWSYINDREQLAKLDNFLIFTKDDLLSHNQDRIEATLNAIAATLEIITQHLSEIARSYFFNIDFDPLVKIRHYLRHINGNDEEHHNAFDKISRAKRLEALAKDKNPDLMGVFVHFMENDFTRIRARIDAYKNFLCSIGSLEITQKFTINTTTFIESTSLEQGAICLRELLEQSDETSYPLEIEDELQYFLRTSNYVAMSSVHEGNDVELKLWNQRVRDTLRITSKNIRKIRPQQLREQIKNAIIQLCPIQSEPVSVKTKQIYCYIKFAANIHYAILCLKRIMEVCDTIKQRQNTILADPQFILWALYDGDVRYSPDPKLLEELHNNSLVLYSVIEWQIVHFFEHAIEFVRNPVFLETYRAHNGDTVEVLSQLKQIRNYVAHVANLKFAYPNGVAAKKNELLELCNCIPGILKGFQNIQQQWKKLLTELRELRDILQPTSFFGNHLFQSPTQPIAQRVIRQQLTSSRLQPHKIARDSSLSQSPQPPAQCTKRQQLLHSGLQLQQIAGDGSCLYRAITYYLSHGEDINLLRNLVAANLTLHAEEYQDFIPLQEDQSLEDYIAQILDTHTFADNVEINILMRLLNRPIVIIGPDGQVRNMEEVNQYKERGEPIFVYYNGENHYDALILTDGDGRAVLVEITGTPPKLTS